MILIDGVRNQVLTQFHQEEGPNALLALRQCQCPFRQMVIKILLIPFFMRMCNNHEDDTFNLLLL